MTGHSWWWQVEYPEFGFETANEIYIPVEKNVHVELVTADVIHSFWLPELSGKVDLIPNHTNTAQLIASQPGAYQGYCAEFCGLQHTLMKFRVVALPQAEFDTWVRGQQAPAAPPNGENAQRGQQLFRTAGCAECHTIQGTDAQGRRGPDLTHIASRRTLAAGTLDNTRDEMARWIRGPDTIKRNSKMPPTELNDADLGALLDYMEQLR